MPDDDRIGDDEPTGPPLPPDDRLWRHPSELSWARLGDSPAPGNEPRQPRGPRPWGLALGAALTGAALALSAVAVVGRGDDDGQRAVDPVPTSAVLPAFAGRSDLADPADRGVPAIADDVARSVVRVDAIAGDGTALSSASGIVVRADGTVLTAAPVVAGAHRVVLVHPDGSTVPATVAGSDRLTGVAVVVAQHDPRDGHEVTWLPAVLGSADGLAVGARVLTVGSTSATAGAVRALRGRAQLGDVVLHGLVELDGPVPDDASGGAVCDETGVVVGLATVVGGVAYAVPADVAASTAEELLRGGVRHAWLGIRGGDADGGGVLVDGVDGPAGAAGLAAGDVIVAVDGEAVVTMSDLVLALRAREPGDAVRLTVVRAAGAVTVEVTLGERP